MNLSRVYFIFLMLMLYGLVYCDEVKGEKKNADASGQKTNSTEEKKEADTQPIETSLNQPDAAPEAKNTKLKSQELVDGKDKSKNPPEVKPDQDKANSNQTAPQKPEEKVPNPNKKGPKSNETVPNLNETSPKIEQNKTDQKPEEKTAQTTDTKKEPEKPKNEKNQEINKETGDEDENENEEENNLDDTKNQEENDQEEKERDKEQPANEKEKGTLAGKDVQTKKGAVGAVVVVGENDDSSTHVMTFFIVLVILLAVCYLAMHNKKKILGLLIEGRSTKARRNVRYRRLSTNDDHESGTTIY